MIKCMFIALVLGLLASCTTAYVAPTEGETAVLIVPVKSPAWRLLGGFTNGRVSFAIKGKNGCGHKYQDLDMPSDTEREIDVVIPANQNIFVSFDANSGSNGCNAAAEFVADPDKQYRVDKIGRVYQCKVGVVEIASNGAEIPVPLTQAYPDAMTGNKICDRQ